MDQTTSASGLCPRHTLSPLTIQLRPLPPTLPDTRVPSEKCDNFCTYIFEEYLESICRTMISTPTVSLHLHPQIQVDIYFTFVTRTVVTKLVMNHHLANNP
jgi:hypothetical protein